MTYEKCLVEVSEVLDRFPIEKLNKIPIEIREGINNKKDRTYQ